MPKDELKLPGWPKIDVVSDEEAEHCEYLVCVPADAPSRFNDNLTGFCCQCGVKVIYRWYAPRTPKRICMECAIKLEELKPPKPSSPT